MGKYFNIAGPCIPERHYMLPAMGRLPKVRRLIEDRSCFVVHAPRQCGKTTAFLSLVDDINARGEAVALYCSLEVVQPFPDPKDGLPRIAGAIRQAVEMNAGCLGEATKGSLAAAVAGDDDSSVVLMTLKALAESCDKPLVVIFDEVDCLSDGTLVGFLRQLRCGRISLKTNQFPASIALVGMRNIRDYKAQVRPAGETLGSASPFNVIAGVMTVRNFTLEEVRSLYAQHTAETGQVFETGAVEQAFAYSGGQPYLVNALARWCMDEIHDRRFSEPITPADMREAFEKIIRERGTHLDSLMERMKESRVRAIIEPVMLGDDINVDALSDDLAYVMDLGLLKEEDGRLVPANPMYAEIMGRYISWGTQQRVRQVVQESPWVRDGGLDMAGLMAAFQQFWRENADASAVPFEYGEAYPQIVLQAFLQRVVNGGGEIVREMALGKKAMDICVRFRGATYAIACKLAKFYAKSHEAAYRQVDGYMDRLGVAEGWLVVFDPDLTKPWDEKIGAEDISRGNKLIHLLRI